MIHSKSIQVLKTFSKEELRQFGDFVRSPFHNKKPTLVKLFEVLKNYHPEYEVENEKVYSKIYPGKEYNHDNMKKLMSEIFLILEKFLLHTKIEEQNFIADKFLLEEYLNRKLNELFLFKVKKVNEKLKQIKYYPDFLSHDKIQFEALKKTFYVRNNIVGKMPSNTLVKKSEYSLCEFLENILSDHSEIRVLRRVSNKFKGALVSESFLKNLDIKIFLKYLSDNKIENNYIVLLINLIMMYMYPENETYFQHAKDYMFNVYISIKENYKNCAFFLKHLENYCSIMVFKGKRKFDFDRFEIQKYKLKIILKNYNHVQSGLYLNLIGGGLRQNELKWVEEFMKENTKYLEEKNKENTYNFAKALLEFEKQNYEESLSYASKLSIRTSYYSKMEISILIMKCYYELSLCDAAFSSIDSCKHYLSKTDEMTVEYVEHYRRILSIIYKFFKLKINTDNNAKNDLLNLKSQITNNGDLTHRWCLQKVEELEKSITIKSLSKKLKKSQSKKHLKSA